MCRKNTCGWFTLIKEMMRFSSYIFLLKKNLYGTIEIHNCKWVNFATYEWCIDNLDVSTLKFVKFVSKTYHGLLATPKKIEMEHIVHVIYNYSRASPPLASHLFLTQRTSLHPTTSPSMLVKVNSNGPKLRRQLILMYACKFSFAMVKLLSMIWSAHRITFNTLC